MGSLFLEQVNKFVNNFIKLFNSDEYISKSKLDSFFDEYKDIIALSNKYDIKNNKTYERFIKIIKFGYDFIEIKNEKYVDDKLIEYKSYFDNMFKGIDDSIKLDEEQRRAILTDEDYSLIVAGAGSGKTTTMVAKVKFLVDKKHINPKEIILLSFTNNSVDDLDYLLNDKFHLGVEVLTFHKLGMKFLRGSSNKKYEIISDSGIYKIIEEYFLNVVFKNKIVLEEYLDIFSKYLHIHLDAMEFNTYDEYYNHYMREKYEECKYDLKSEINKRVANRSLYLKTINGEIVKSDGELRIANFLFRNGIDYNYEELYPHILFGNKTYKPDFTIYDGDMKYYLEFFGIAKLNTDGSIDSESRDYIKEIYNKRKAHRDYHTDLIEIYGRYESKEWYITRLFTELKKRNLPVNKRTDKEIFIKLLETSKSFKYTNLINLIIMFISIFKEKGNTVEDFDRLINSCEDDLIKKQIRAIKDVYIYYERRIRSSDRIDFQDMINYAYYNVETFKENHNKAEIKYVIIDEYQDVSFQRFNLVKKISDIFKSKVVAVGDDWQTIYSFSGSDISLFIDFERNMGYSKKIKIVNTYRNSQELIDTAGDFILKNENQIEKHLHSDKHLNKPIRLVEYKYDENGLNSKDYINTLVELIKSIYKARPKDNLLLLARFNSEIDDLLLSKKFYRTRLDDKKITCKEVPECNIDILTVHKAKGLGYDRVILLNGIDATKGFPSKIKDEPIIKFIKDKRETELNELIDYPEERRLFYVAMTRTKNELYIMTPVMHKNKSEFVREIEQNENVKVTNVDKK